MKKLMYVFIAVTFVMTSSCGNKEKKEPADEEMDDLTLVEETKTELAVVNGVGGYGKEITPEGAVAVTELVADMTKANGYTGKVSGEIETCCQNKGCWMEMDLGNGETMRITFKDYGFFVPMDTHGKRVVVEGKAGVQSISVEDQKHFAQDEGKSQAEIDAITQPKEELVFVADGVIAI